MAFNILWSHILMHHISKFKIKRCDIDKSYLQIFIYFFIIKINVNILLYLLYYFNLLYCGCTY